MSTLSTVVGFAVLAVFGAFGVACIWIEGRMHRRRSDEGHAAVLNSGWARALQSRWGRHQQDLIDEARLEARRRLIEAERLRAAEEVDDGR